MQERFSHEVAVKEFLALSSRYFLGFGARGQDGLARESEPLGDDAANAGSAAGFSDHLNQSPAKPAQ